MERFLAGLVKIAGKENIFTEKATLAAALPASSRPPLAVAKPVNLAQCADLIAFCAEHSIPLIFRGGNTHQIPCKTGSEFLLLSTLGLNRILELDRENLVAHVQAGVTFGQLLPMLRQEGMFLPGLSCNSPMSTAGGAIAANLANSQARKYGSICSYTRKLEIITGAGERFTCGAGNGWSGCVAPAFPLAQLFCGSNGCLGILGSMVIRLLPMPDSACALAAIFDSTLAAAKAAREIAASSLLPDRIFITDSLCSGILPQGLQAAKPQLLLEYMGNAQELNEGKRISLEICRKNHVQEIRELPALPEGLDYWLPAAVSRLGDNLAAGRFTFPPTGIVSFVENLASLASERGLEAAFYGDPGVCSINVCLAGPTAAMEQSLRDLFLLELILNRQLKEESEAEKGKAEWQKSHSQLTMISDKIRQIFDPANILALNEFPAGGRA